MAVHDRFPIVSFYPRQIYRVFSVVTGHRRCLVHRRSVLRRVRCRLIYRFLRGGPYFVYQMQALRCLSQSKAIHLQAVHFSLYGHTQFMPPNVVGRGFYVRAGRFMGRVFAVVVYFFSSKTTHRVSRNVRSIFYRFLHVSQSSAPRVHSQPMIPGRFAMAFFVRLNGTRAIFVHVSILYRGVRYSFTRVRINSSPNDNHSPGIVLRVRGSDLHRLVDYRSVNFRVVYRIRGRFVGQVCVGVFQHRVFRVCVVSPHAMFRVGYRPQEYHGMQRFQLANFSTTICLFCFLGRFGGPNPSQGPVFFRK